LPMPLIMAAATASAEGALLLNLWRRTAAAAADGSLPLAAAAFCISCATPGVATGPNTIACMLFSTAYITRWYKLTTKEEILEITIGKAVKVAGKHLVRLKRQKRACLLLPLAQHGCATHAQLSFSVMRQQQVHHAQHAPASCDLRWMLMYQTCAKTLLAGARFSYPLSLNCLDCTSLQSTGHGPVRVKCTRKKARPDASTMLSPPALIRL
jgi:hypothetical protein